MRQPNASYFQNQRQGVESDRYVPIEASKIGEVFQTRGFNLIDFKSGKARDSQYENHQRTVTRFRQVESPDTQHHNDITLIAPHLGRGTLTLVLGTYRLVCSNGLTVGDVYGTFKVKHLGDVESKLDQAIGMLLSQAETMHNQIALMRSIKLSYNEQKGLAGHLAAIRLKDVNGVDLNSINLDSLIQVRRHGDIDNDLWTTFNRIQESICRFGFKYIVSRYFETAPNVFESRLVQARTRSLKPLTVKSIEVNKALWSEVTKLVGLGEKWKSNIAK